MTLALLQHFALWFCKNAVWEYFPACFNSKIMYVWEGPGNRKVLDGKGLKCVEALPKQRD